MFTLNDLSAGVALETENSSADDFENIADEQQRWMGVAVTPNFKKSAYFIDREREELEMSNQNSSNHHALYVGARILFKYIFVFAKLQVPV